MVIQCEECKTVYNIADSNAHGQARCVRCGHIFAVDATQEIIPPQQFFDSEAPTDNIDVAAEQAPATEPIAAAEQLPPIAAATAAPEQESRVSAPSVATVPVEPPLPEEQPFSFSASDTDAETAPTAEIAEETQPVQQAEVELPSPLDDEGFSFSAPEQDVDDVPAAVDTPEPTEFSATESDTFTFAPQPDKEPDSTDTPVEEQQLDADPGAFTFASMSDELDSTPKEPLITEQESIAPAELPQEEPQPSQPATKPQRKQQPPAPRKTSKLLVLLLIIILLLAGAYGYLFTTPGTTDIGTMIKSLQQQFDPAPATPQGTIKIGATSSYYLDNDEAGQLFIVEGHAINGFTSPRAEMKVIATLYKKGGKSISRQSAYCGNVIDNDQLKHMPVSAIKKTMKNPFGTALNNTSVAPGQKLPFMVIFTKIPANMNEFSVEASTSKPSSH